MPATEIGPRQHDASGDDANADLGAADYGEHKASPFAPPTVPSSLPAMIAAVIPASCAATAKEFLSIVATKAHPAPQNARPARKATRFYGKHAVSTTIATAPTTVPTMRNQPLRKEAPSCGWQTRAAVVPAQ